MADTITRVGAATNPASLGVFAPPGWQAAIDNVVANGREEDLDQGTTIGFRVTSGDPDGAHHMSSMNVWGERDATGKFIVHSVALDDRDWHVRSDGKFYMDEWIHTLSPSGSVWNPLHYFQVISHDGDVENSGSVPQSAGDPRANLAALIAKWSTYRPAPSATADQEAARRAAAALTPAIAVPTPLAAPSVKNIRRPLAQAGALTTPGSSRRPST